MYCISQVSSAIIRCSKASGPDQFFDRMSKFTAASIAAPVTKLYNQSISSGCFPVTWKRLNIVPIPKSGDKASPENYRPVSILSKLLERHIANLLLQHLMATQPISDSQWSFQMGKSIVTALLETTHNWFEMLGRGKEVGAVFVCFLL